MSERRRWWNHRATHSARAQMAAGGVALALVAVTAIVWLTPAVDPVDEPTVSAAEQRLTAENERLRASLEARQQELDDLRRSQAKAAAERAAGQARGQEKAAAERAATEQRGREKAAAERAAAAERGRQKAAAERAAAAARGQEKAALERELAEARGDAEGAQIRAAAAVDAAEAAQARAEASLASRQPTAAPATQAPPQAPPLSELLQPAKRYFGLYTTQSPFSWAEFDDVATKVDLDPTMVGYFQGWDGPFRSDAVTRSWQRGVLPLLTWESRPLAAGNDEPEDPDYSLPRIIDGAYDDYLHQYARDVAALGLPVAIRLDHEMNGAWYPWSERGQGGQALNGNRPGDFATMWRHVHDIFAAEGANAYVIWVWAPNIVNNLPSGSDDPEFLRSLYPGDEYVDWLGVSGYYRPPYKEDQTPTFSYTYDRTLDQLRDISGKPILLAEIGASEVGGNKARWVTDLFDALARPENGDIIGLAWFNLAVTTISGGERVTNDWRITSRPDSQQAFVDGIHDPAAGFVEPMATVAAASATSAQAAAEPSPETAPAPSPEPAADPAARVAPEPAESAPATASPVDDGAGDAGEPAAEAEPDQTAPTDTATEDPSSAEPSDGSDDGEARRRGDGWADRRERYGGGWSG